MPAASHHSRGLVLVALLKLVEAALLVLLAGGAFHLLHKDVGETLEKWVRMAHVDPGNRLLSGLLAKAGLADDRRLKQLGGLTLAYAALFVVEGVGLLRHKRWAEFLTVIATASFVPFEIFELCKHASAMKALVLVANAAIVVYLIVILRTKEQENAG